MVAGLPGRLRVPRMAVFGLLTILFPRAADIRPLAGIRQMLFRSKHAFCFQISNQYQFARLGDADTILARGRVLRIDEFFRVVA